VTALAVPGGAAEILVSASRRARLVVAGGRGHGPIVGTLLGSVGLALLHHAECPVLIARHHPTKS
jgi:nucleotide-binding universal stress UspA family protein